MCDEEDYWDDDQEDIEKWEEMLSDSDSFTREEIAEMQEEARRKYEFDRELIMRGWNYIYMLEA